LEKIFFASLQTNINLSWNTVSGATQYNVYQDGTVIPVTIYTNSYSVGVSCGTTHSYYVIAGNVGGWSGASNTVSGTALTCTLVAPTGLKVTGTTQTNINLTWNTVTAATVYNVYQDGTVIPVTIHTNSFSVGVLCGTNHSYYVIAGDDYGNWSGPSNIVNGTALPCTIARISTKSNPLKGGTTSGGGKYMSGTLVTVRATPATGYDFINWTENGSLVSTNSTYTFTVIGYRTLTANFSLQLKRYYYVKDHLGSIRVTVDVTGDVKSYDDYDPWGLQLAGRSLVSGTNGKYKFTGKERDIETGFDYFGARYYDSWIGRWMAVDPLAEKYPGWSPYNYVANNPINLIDPKGKDWYQFDNNGNYKQKISAEGTHRIVIHTVEKTGDGLESDLYKFVDFADPLNDAMDIDNGTINKLVFVSENEIQSMLSEQGAFESGKINFGLESQGGGKFDYSFSILPEKYPNANFTGDDKSNSLFLPEGDNTAHNFMNFGNYLWAASGYAAGFGYGELQMGAHLNSLLNARRNGYPSQWDSKDDQRSIIKGTYHAQKNNYRKLRK